MWSCSLRRFTKVRFVMSIIYQLSPNAIHNYIMRIKIGSSYKYGK